PTTTPTTKATSTFTFIDYNTGEDVSAWVEASVWTPDPDDIPFDDSEDIFRIVNFDEDVSSSDADGISIDLRSHDYAWLQIDPDYESDFGGYNAVFATPTVDDFRLLIGGANYDYVFYVYHEPSDVDIVVLDRGRGMDVWNVTVNGTLGPGLWSVLSDEINGTVVMNMPWNSTAGLHAGTTGGDEWDIDEDDLDDFEADIDAITLRYGEEMQWLRDQRNFRTIAPYYDLVDDTLKDYDSKLERVTNAFAVRFTFNDTLNTTDYFNPTTPGLIVDTQVNFTLQERDYFGEPVEVVIGGTMIYVIYTEPITFDGIYSFDFEIFLGVDVNCTAVETGRLVVPRGNTNLGAYTVYSAAKFLNLLGFFV
ncbi:hypothetical protein LCGC14_2851060, partial [marine sediment metagenome]